MNEPTDAPRVRYRKPKPKIQARIVYEACGLPYRTAKKTSELQLANGHVVTMFFRKPQAACSLEFVKTVQVKDPKTEKITWAPRVIDELPEAEMTPQGFVFWWAQRKSAFLEPDVARDKILKALGSRIQ